MIDELDFGERWNRVNDSGKLKLDTYRHLVLIPTDETLDHYEWCVEFCEGYFTTWSTDDGEEFQFEIESDAMAFKLRWI